ncbi:MAG: hypothetical protein KY457_06320, partial [Actinobacteria bacterium]|nr:hypothetical protein [Actinomycetota bacterium]
LPGAGVAHELDHPAPSFSTGLPLSSAINAGGEGAAWELITTFATGNPHTDLDFFTQDGETYAAVGTLAIGPNGGGQTIIKLTEGGEISPSFVASHPSAACLSDPAAALGLQHDVEATPKGETLLNTTNPFADRRDAQLLVDATDAGGRCHDQGALGLEGVPQGGLEIIDITDVTAPVEIALTSHIGEAHTVNVDPKRPHIAYSVTSDAVGVKPDAGDRDNDGDTEEPVRQNELPTVTNAQGNEVPNSDRFDLDGFEVVDLSSCMDFPEGTSVEQKREQCRPEVYRYRYPDLEMVLGHTNTGTIYGCHELEIYPDDRLTCGSGSAMIALDMAGAFDDMGTPDDFSDDKPRGRPLPCRVRESSTAALFTTGAMVIDCVVGEDDADLTIPAWLESGAPSLEGVRWLGSAIHMGRESATGAFDPAFPPTEDIDFDHEAELTHSGKFVLATDERGGGVLPPGASCASGADNPVGNGGIHAYRVDQLTTERPATPEEAFRAYAATPDGEKPVFRAQIRTGAEAAECTAHVFQQVPGQNRIFMGWYSQGTQVVDYIEHPDGTFEFVEAGYFIPENANTWTSAVFKVDENEDGTFTYYGATGDFLLGDNGRSAIDVYSVTLPPPAQAAGEAPAPAPAPEEPAPAPQEPDAAPLPATGGGSTGWSGILFVLGMSLGGSELLRRRRPSGA